jgi:hypothetical protein
MTTATPAIADRVRDFVAAVGEHFADLPDAEREELLGDLEQHLTELAAEAPDVLETELGDPAAYAAELRAGAGLSEGGRKRPGRIARLTTTTRDRVRAVVDHARMTPLHEFLPMLRPAWWIVRAWSLIVVLALLVDGGTQLWARHILVPGRNMLGLAALVAAVAFSVRAGMAGNDDGRVWRTVNRLAAFAVAVIVWIALTAAPVETAYVETYSDAGAPYGLLTHPDGEGITNLYVYDAEGTLLQDVFVYDGGGRPVEIGPETDDWYGIRSEPRSDAAGRVIGNLYPIVQYVEDGEGGLVLREPPQVDIPRLPNGAASVSTTLPPAPQEPPTSDTLPLVPPR